MTRTRYRLITGASRGVAAAFGLLFAAGVIMKLLDFEATRDAMTAYSILDFLPPALPAVGSLVLEAFVAVTLILHGTWQRWGLPAAALFLTVTGIMLVLETLAGGAGDCGCIPFLPRDISLLAAAQNGAQALFLGSLWRYLETLRGERTAASGADANTDANTDAYTDPNTDPEATESATAPAPPADR